MKLSEMKQILAEGNIQLSRSLGQNFMHDGNQLRRIVRAAGLGKSDKVLEIGPGLGPLTELLLARAGEVLAIEKDARLIDVLRKRFEASSSESSSALDLLHDDALEYLKRAGRDWAGWKLVANLPYSVASPILVELALAPRGPERMVVTLQIEVARRLMARASQADYGLLTLLIQLDYQPQEWFRIRASCFFPQPDVDSACVILLRRERPPLTLTEKATYIKIVKRSFSQRRKMMVKLLREDWPAEKLEQAFDREGLPLQIRAEDVSLESFIGLTRSLER